MRIGALAFVLLIVAACTGGADPTSGDGGATSSGAASSSGGGGTSSSGTTATSSSGGSSSGATSSSSGSTTADSGPSCVTKTVVVATGGTSSSCGYPFTENWQIGKVNVRFEPGGPVCARFGGQCGNTGGGPGWWISGQELDLCDNSCVNMDTPGVKLIAELGCDTVYCTN